MAAAPKPPPRDDARPPDYVLQLSERDGKRRNSNAGAAWHNAAGGISLTINPGVVLDAALCERYYVTLWPPPDPPKRDGSRRGEPGDEEPTDDDLPF